MNIIGEFSTLSRLKVYIERTFPTLYEYLYLHPCAKIQDHFNKWNDVAGNIRKKHISEMMNGVTCDNCCINMWGTSWSFEYYPPPFFIYYLLRPKVALKRLLNGY